MPFGIWAEPIGDLHPQHDGKPHREAGWDGHMLFDTYEQAAAYAERTNASDSNRYWFYSAREIWEKKDEPPTVQEAATPWHERLMEDD